MHNPATFGTAHYLRSMGATDACKGDALDAAGQVDIKACRRLAAAHLLETGEDASASLLEQYLAGVRHIVAARAAYDMAL